MNYQKLGLHHLAEKINVIVEEEEVILWKNDKKTCVQSQAIIVIVLDVLEN